MRRVSNMKRIKGVVTGEQGISQMLSFEKHAAKHTSAIIAI